MQDFYDGISKLDPQDFSNWLSTKDKNNPEDQRVVSNTRFLLEHRFYDHTRFTLLYLPCKEWLSKRKPVPRQGRYLLTIKDNNNVLYGQYENGKFLKIKEDLLPLLK